MKALIIIPIILVFLASSLPAQYQPNPDGWNFYNYLMTTDDDELWDIYSKSFLGVAQEKAQASAEDLLFYDLIISNYAGHASCFGMSLLSLICFHEGGHLGVCGPVYKYEGGLAPGSDGSYSGPDLDAVRESISIMHLRQLTQPMISKLIDLFNDSNWNDPEYAFNQIQTSIASHDYPLLSFMPSSIAAIEALGQGAEAHTVVPYATSDTGTHYRIYIYDPNFPYSISTDFYTGATQRNYIDIKKSGWTHDWKYPSDYNPSDPNSYGWNGSTTGPWTFLATNVSDAKYKDNHPLDIGYITGQIGTLIFSSGGSAQQISDDNGRNFYTSTGGTLELEKDPARKTNDIILWPYFHGKPEFQETYFIQDIQNKSYEVEVAAGAKGYQCQLLAGERLIEIESGKAKAGRDNLHFTSIGTDQQEIVFSSNRKIKDMNLNLKVILPDRKTVRTFALTELEMDKNEQIVLSLTDRDQTLSISSPRVKLEYKLELIERKGDQEIRSKKEKITVQPGERKMLNPESWQNLRDSKLQMEVRKLKN